MTRTDKNRVLWVERAQVISMLLVVLHHCVPHGYDGPEWLLGLLNAIQYPALVCFFLTSGLFATKWKARGWAAYMKRRCLRLLPPYFCVNLLMLLPRWAAARLMGHEARITVGWLLTSFVDPHGQGIAPHLWFLPTLLIMAALTPVIDALTARDRRVRLATVAALLALSALPVKLPTLLCLNELKLYLAWFVIGYTLAVTGRARDPFPNGKVAGALCGTGAAAFVASLLAPELPIAVYLQMLGGLTLMTLCLLDPRDDALTAAFRGKTYAIYILSMCAQNLAEVVGYSLHLPWFATFAAMLAVGLAVPCLLWAWNERRPLPGWLRAIVGL